MSRCAITRGIGAGVGMADRVYGACGAGSRRARPGTPAARWRGSRHCRSKLARGPVLPSRVTSASPSTEQDTTHPGERAGHTWEARHFGMPAAGWRRRWFIVIFENDTRAGRRFDVWLLVVDRGQRARRDARQRAGDLRRATARCSMSSSGASRWRSPPSTSRGWRRSSGRCATRAASSGSSTCCRSCRPTSRSSSRNCTR